jgi:hypothetical protein
VGALISHPLSAGCKEESLEPSSSIWRVRAESKFLFSACRYFGYGAFAFSNGRVVTPSFDPFRFR